MNDSATEAYLEVRGGGLAVLRAADGGGAERGARCLHRASVRRQQHRLVRRHCVRRGKERRVVCRLALRSDV